MAQYSLNAYDADIYIPLFKGLYEYGDQMGGDLRYAAELNNVETPAGVLQPAPKLEGVGLIERSETEEAHTVAAPDFGKLLYLRTKNGNAYAETVRYGNGTGFVFSGGEYDVYYIAAESKLYCVLLIGDLKRTGYYENVEYLSTGIGKSWCTYELSLYDSDPAQGIPEHLIFQGNCLISTWGSKTLRVFYAGLTYVTVSVPDTFSYIERFAERIWGCGGSESPDSIFYSRPYDLRDWTQNDEIPEDGGGEIKLPTWDKDQIVALKAFGSYLIVFSKKRAWRISGSDPSNFYITEQYGNGCPYPETIGVLNNRIIMLGDDGLLSYDGEQVAPLKQAETKEFFRTIDWTGTVLPKATVIGNKYILSLCNALMTATRPAQDGGDDLVYSGEYKMLVYDAFDDSITVMDTPPILSFCNGMPYALTYVPEKDGVAAHNEIVPLEFDSWAAGRITDQPTKWVTPWVTFSRPDIKKGGFEIYFTPEIKPEKRIVDQRYTANATGNDPSQLVTEEHTGPVTFKITIETEKKAKTKLYTVQPLTAEQIAAGKRYKAKRIHIGGNGRRFRLRIETDGGNIPWRLIGGVHIIAETDKD